MTHIYPNISYRKIVLPQLLVQMTLFHDLDSNTRNHYPIGRRRGHFIMGSLVIKAKPERNQTSKFYTSYEQWTGEHYPNYLSGNTPTILLIYSSLYTTICQVTLLYYLYTRHYILLFVR